MPLLPFTGFNSSGESFVKESILGAMLMIKTNRQNKYLVTAAW
jgi:hypothetical protein